MSLLLWTGGKVVGTERKECLGSRSVMVVSGVLNGDQRISLPANSEKYDSELLPRQDDIVVGSLRWRRQDPL